MRRELTALTTLAVITIAWIGFTLWVDTDDTEPPPPEAPISTGDDPAGDDGSSDEPDGDDGADDDDEDYGPAERVVIEHDVMTIEGAVSHPMTSPESAEESHAELRFEAGDEPPENRAPLNVALVVDRSGSMRGDPMVQARRAARTFVDQLEPQDRITLVSFDHEVVTDVESIAVDQEGRAMLLDAIDDLDARGATNISGGLRRGYEEVLEYTDPQMVQRVVLMTDGIPNRGITDADGLANQAGGIQHDGVSVSTLGFGPDYDAELLAMMATEGAGNFRHISDAEDLERAFDDEIDDLQSTVASGLEVELHLQPGVEIEEVYGFSRHDADDHTRITLGDLETEGRRSAVISLDTDTPDVDPGELRDLLDVRISYVDRLADEDVDEQFELDTRITDREDAVEEAVDTDVMVRVEEQRTLQSLREIEERYQAGDREGAQQRIESTRQRIDEAQDSYGGSAGLGRADDIMEDREETISSGASPRSDRARDQAAESEAMMMEVEQGR